MATSQTLHALFAEWHQRSDIPETASRHPDLFWSESGEEDGAEWQFFVAREENDLIFYVINRRVRLVRLVCRGSETGVTVTGLQMRYGMLTEERNEIWNSYVNWLQPVLKFITAEDILSKSPFGAHGPLRRNRDILLSLIRPE